MLRVNQIISHYWDFFHVKFYLHSSLTLGTHAPEGYSGQFVCVCLSVHYRASCYCNQSLAQRKVSAHVVQLHITQSRARHMCIKSSTRTPAFLWVFQLHVPLSYQQNTGISHCMKSYSCSHLEILQHAVVEP